MNIKNRTIGIWGFGRVGAASALFLQRLGADIVVYDDNPVECHFRQSSTLTQFFEQADVIVPSPGIDIRKYYSTYQGKWLAELDLFHHFFRKKIIAVTGSIGKTTVTHSLATILKHTGWRILAAGNIGLPCLNLIAQQDSLDAVVLEVSSFQLEHCQSFAPDLAIWTNLYPNHLDRHGSIDSYFTAKYHLLAHQRSNQNAILPIDLKDQIEQLHPHSKLHFFDPSQPSTIALTGFPTNILIIEKALELLGVSYQACDIQPLEHRLENVATINGIIFYNDSKSTTPTSTLAAIERLKKPGEHMVLILGGLSKGIDRSSLVEQLKYQNITVISFGHESAQLHDLCRKNNIPSFSCITLSEVFSLITQIPTQTVLFSPSGSSFDQFKNFEERGNYFKQLVIQYEESSH